MIPTLDVKYDACSDVLMIDGIKYNASLFRSLKMITPENQCFRVVQRDDDGVVTLQDYYADEAGNVNIRDGGR